MPSPFYNLTFPQHPLRISFLLVERITLKLEALPEDAREDAQGFVQLVADAIKDVEQKTPNEDQLQSVMERLRDSAEKAGKAADKKPPSDKGFAAGFMKWVQEMTPVETCLLAANYDAAEAARLFKEVDKDTVMKLAELYLRRDWEHIKVGYEGSVYAFGGGFSGDGGSSGPSGDGTTVHDMTVDNPKGMAALKKLF